MVSNYLPGGKSTLCYQALPTDTIPALCVRHSGGSLQYTHRGGRSSGRSRTPVTTVGRSTRVDGVSGPAERSSNEWKGSCCCYHSTTIRALSAEHTHLVLAQISFSLQNFPRRLISCCFPPNLSCPPFFLDR